LLSQAILIFRDIVKPLRSGVFRPFGFVRRLWLCVLY